MGERAVTDTALIFWAKEIYIFFDMFIFLDVCLILSVIWCYIYQMKVKKCH